MTQSGANSGADVDAGDANALARTLVDVSARLRALPLRDPWWVIGSAAAALAGVEGFLPHDVDLLLSARDADAFAAAHRDAIDAAYAPADADRFRSRFARFRFAPLPVETMGGLEVLRHGVWREVAIAATAHAVCAGVEIPIPTLAEQLRLFEWFGRDKDLAKAQRLRRRLAAGAAPHAA